MSIRSICLTAIAFFGLTALLIAAPALADYARPTELGFQPAASPVMHKMVEFHNMMLWIISIITVFVLLLLVYVVIRFNAKANPVPSKTTHHVGLEIVWTVVPILILLAISYKSFPLLYYMDRAEKPEMTLKVKGYQWYWGYEYPGQGIEFTANMIPDKEIDKTKKQMRLLSTDNPVVLPVDTTIQILVTAEDVLHAFAMPAFGVKMDAVPGRTNETWVKIEKPGIYYGQCSELCGKNHAFMPIEIHAVSKEDYAAWIEEAKKKFADGGSVLPSSPLYAPVKMARQEAN